MTNPTNDDLGRMEQYKSHLEKLLNEIGKDEFKTFVTFVFGKTGLSQRRAEVITSIGDFDLEQLVAITMEQEKLLNNTISYAHRECEKTNTKHFLAWCDFVGAIDGKIAERDKAGTWAKNRDDFVEVSPDTPLQDVAHKLDDDKVLIVLVIDQNRQLIRVISRPDIVRERELRKTTKNLNSAVASELGTAKENIVKYLETTHMQELCERLLLRNENPRIRQVVIEFLDGSFGIVSVNKAYAWEEGRDPS